MRYRQTATAEIPPAENKMIFCDIDRKSDTSPYSTKMCESSFSGGKKAPSIFCPMCQLKAGESLWGNRCFVLSEASTILAGANFG
jgi:hypothetical protein